jgi:hypothetical protein
VWRSFPEASFGQQGTNLGFWTVTKNGLGTRIAIGIVFKADTDSLLKLLPDFITELKVALVAIAEATPPNSARKQLFFKNQRGSELAPYFDADWVFNSGHGTITMEHVFPDGLPSELSDDQKSKLEYNFTVSPDHPLMNIMGREQKPLRKVYIKQGIDPIQLQLDPKNFGYVIVQVCSDITLSMSECGKTPGNFIVVVADHQYKFSPFIRDLMIYLRTRLSEYYLYLVCLFAMIVLGLGAVTRHYIKKDITGPIIMLKKTINEKQRAKTTDDSYYRSHHQDKRRTQKSLYHATKNKRASQVARDMEVTQASMSDVNEDVAINQKSDGDQDF